MAAFSINYRNAVETSPVYFPPPSCHAGSFGLTSQRSWVFTALGRPPTHCHASLHLLFLKITFGKKNQPIRHAAFLYRGHVVLSQKQAAVAGWRGAQFGSLQEGTNQPLSLSERCSLKGAKYEMAPCNLYVWRPWGRLDIFPPKVISKIQYVIKYSITQSLLSI